MTQPFKPAHNPAMQSTGSDLSSFTARQAVVLKRIRQVTPPSFIATVPGEVDANIRLLGIVGLALSDINQFPPLTGYTFDNLPDAQLDLLALGTQLYLLAFQQMKFTLIDVSYSDGAYSINLDRVGKIGNSYKTFEELFLRQVENYKRNVLMGLSGSGLATPRYSQISRFINMVGSGSAFGWNLP